MNAALPRNALNPGGCDACTVRAPGVHRRNAAWFVVAALLLAGCAADPGFRDQGARMSATTRFDPEEMRGRWVVRERLAVAVDPLARAPEAFDFGAVKGDRLALTWTHRVCEGETCTDRQLPLTARLSGPGRYVVARGGAGAVEHWVMWTDADYRVAAIGTPSGEFGWIMSRGEARADLMQAAREIMDWNGYDLSLLQGVEE